MNSESRRAVFAETHKAIEEAAKSAVDALTSRDGPQLVYPPGATLSPGERVHLKEIVIPPEAKEVLEKVIADACSHPIFHMMSLLDGVAEPYVIEIPEWVGGRLAGDEGELMLHDEFFESYWDYHERKKDAANPEKVGG